MSEFVLVASTSELSENGTLLVEVDDRGLEIRIFLKMGCTENPLENALMRSSEAAFHQSVSKGYRNRLFSVPFPRHLNDATLATSPFHLLENKASTTVT